MKKALKIILPAILLISSSALPAYASVVQTSFGAFYYPTTDSMTITGTNGNYILIYNLTQHSFFYTGNGGTLPITKPSGYLESHANAHVGDNFAVVASNALSGACTTPNITNCRASSQYQGEADFVFGVAPPPPPPTYTWFDPTVIAPSFTNGVINTGAMLWPMFVFMGILIAFWIATKVGDFVRDAAMKRRESKRKPYYEETYSKEQIAAITDKIKELGDRNSFDE